ncbi:MAG TPA: hypothetical protein VFY23_15415 [Candidatus Limnocylindrales bacterium]|nr:hypothetical protein [Candidatus Limnocylindrales bacterium]
MTTERGSFEDPGSDPNAMGDDALGNVDAVVGTREDEMTSSGLSDAPFPSGASTSSTTTSPTADRDTAWATGSGTSLGSSSSSGSGDRLQDAASGVVDRVAGTAQQQVGTQVNSQLSHGADVLGQVSRAIRQSGEQLREEQPQIATFADTAAQQVDKVGDFLRQTDFPGLVREAEGFARRQPAVFLGGAMALGILASRFLKASPQGGSQYGGSEMGRGFRSGYGSGYGAYGGSGYSGSSYGAGGMGYVGGTGGTGSAGSTYGAGYGTGAAGSGSYGSAQANYSGQDTGPYGGSGGTSRYAEAGSGADINTDEGAERGGV